MGNIAEYIRALYRHYVYMVTSTILAVLATGWGFAGGGTLKWSILAVIALTLFAVAGYQAWREQHDQLMPLLERKKKAAALNEVLMAANDWWQRAVNARNNHDEGRQWCKEYDEWIRSAKERVATEVDPSEATVIFQIGDSRQVQPVGWVIEEQGNRMGYLSHHMEQLREALKRYLP